MGRYTEAQARSAKKYLAKFEEIRLRMSAEEKEKIKADAKKAGKSVNQYILDVLLPLRVQDPEKYDADS